MTLEKPECSIGYPQSQLERILGDRLDEFNRWMNGQTMTLCDGRSYCYECKQYRETGCGPHGPVVYQWDLGRYLAGKPIID